jgi:hypothetical protein
MSLQQSSDSRASAVYGLRLVGVDAAEMLAVANGEPWPEVRVLRRLAPRESVRRGFGGLRACFEFPEGRLLIEREEAAITTVTEEPLPDDQLVHPWLTLAGGMWARWLGRDAFHGGAILVDGGAWAVLGQQADGKSTLLAWLALHGYQVMCDDLLVIEDGHVFAGPRCVDLRPDAVESLAKRDLPHARGDSRRRVQLAPVPTRAPLRGVVHLAWGDEIAITTVPLRERIDGLRAHNSFLGVPADKATLLELAALPNLEFRRPRRFDSLAPAADELLAAIRA